MPKNASGSLKPPVLRLQKGIILRWSVVGYRWPTATNLQNGYRISPCPSASTNIKNEPLRRKPSTPIALRQGARVIEDSRRCVRNLWCAREFAKRSPRGNRPWTKWGFPRPRPINLPLECHTRAGFSLTNRPALSARQGRRLDRRVYPQSFGTFALT